MAERSAGFQPADREARCLVSGVAELTLEIMGGQGLGWEGEDFTREEIETVRGWLSGKATTIFGGSQEIQSNIISKRILGLPDPTQSAS